MKAEAEIRLSRGDVLRIRGFAPLAHRPFKERLVALVEAASYFKSSSSPGGINLEGATAIIEYLRKFFADIKVTTTPKGGSWVLVVSWNVCPACRRAFDSKDQRAPWGDGWVHCPACGRQVLKEKQ